MDDKQPEQEALIFQEEYQQELWQCIIEIRKGSQHAFNRLYYHTENFVYFCMVKNGIPEYAVADIMQEVYIAIYQNLDSLKDIHAALGWIKSIAYHKSMDYFRQKKRESFIQDEEFLVENGEYTDTMKLPEDIVDNKETQRLMGKLIQELPGDYRQILSAYYYNERKVDEIAEDLGIPSGTVKTKLFRARKQLQESIEKLEREQGIRLHSVSALPVFLLLFNLEAQSAQVPADISKTVEIALKKIGKEVLPGAVSSAGSNLAGNVVVKCLIGVAAAAIISTSIILITKNSDDNPDSSASSTASETEENSTDASAAEETQVIDPQRQGMIREYYRNMFNQMCTTHQWPDGTDMAVSGDFESNIQYSLLDFNRDGYEEFIVSVIDADSMTAFREELYSYDPETEQCRHLLSIYPGADYYDNGVVFGPQSNAERFGKNLFYYDTAKEEYVNQLYVFCWERSNWPEYRDMPFPEEIDADGDRMVWCFEDREGNYSYMDTREYEAWFQKQTGNANKLDIQWTLFSEGWQY